MAAFLAGSPLLAAPQEQLLNVFDFDAAAKAKLPKTAYEYVSGGAWDEWTLRRNRTMFERIIFQPRFFRQVDKLDLSLTLFGQKMSMPILVAPTGTHALVHPDGELATVRGAGAAGASMVVSTSSSFPLEKISAEARTPLWFQLYTGPDAEGTKERVIRAVETGCKAICVTVDAPYQAPREKDARNGLVRVFREDSGGSRQRRYSEEAPGSPSGLPMRFQATLNWSFLDQLCGYAKVPVLVKGQPIAGAQKGGLTGFLRGVARGVAGVVALPVGGVIDVAGSVLTSLHRSASGEAATMRLRCTRYLPRDGVVRPFARREARGHLLYLEFAVSSSNRRVFQQALQGGTGSSEEYMMHWELEAVGGPGSPTTLSLADSRQPAGSGVLALSPLRATAQPQRLWLLLTTRRLAVMCGSGSAVGSVLAENVLDEKWAAVLGAHVYPLAQLSAGGVSRLGPKTLRVQLVRPSADATHPTLSVHLSFQREEELSSAAGALNALAAAQNSPVSFAALAKSL